MSSDEFFLKHPAVPNLDLAFVDGLHLSEVAFADCIGALRLLQPHGILAIHDTLPPNYEAASRLRTTQMWAGDVWKIGWLLQSLLPANVVTLPVAPTGLTIVLRPTDAEIERVSRDGAQLLANLDWETHFGEHAESVAPFDGVLAWIGKHRRRSGSTGVDPIVRALVILRRKHPVPLRWLGV